MADIVNALPQGTILRGTKNTYQIQRVLGQGSFGITYLATIDMQVSGQAGGFTMKAQVAVKEFFMRGFNGREGSSVTAGSQGGYFEDYKRKFIREAVNLSKLNHPNIVKVLEPFEANGTAYYAMEYIDGGNLEEYIQKRGALKEGEALSVIRQVGSALAEMHRHRMLHLDLKPGNIMLRKTGEAVLIDFGLSKQFDKNGEPESSTTLGGGTPGYAPIEQANYQRGDGLPVTMDVYALGATLYKMLTGERPPKASDVLNEGLSTASLKQKGVSAQTISVIMKSMVPMCKQRCQSVRELLEALNIQNIQDETIIVDSDNNPTGDKDPHPLDDESGHTSSKGFWGALSEDWKKRNNFVNVVLYTIEILAVCSLIPLFSDTLWSLSLLDDPLWTFGRVYSKGCIPGLLMSIMILISNWLTLRWRKDGVYLLVLSFILIPLPMIWREFQGFCNFSVLPLLGLAVYYALLRIPHKGSSVWSLCKLHSKSLKYWSLSFLILLFLTISIFPIVMAKSVGFNSNLYRNGMTVINARFVGRSYYSNDLAKAMAFGDCDVDYNSVVDRWFQKAINEGRKEDETDFLKYRLQGAAVDYVYFLAKTGRDSEAIEVMTKAIKECGPEEIKKEIESDEYDYDRSRYRSKVLEIFDSAQ